MQCNAEDAYVNGMWQLGLRLYSDRDLDVGVRAVVEIDLVAVALDLVVSEDGRNWPEEGTGSEIFG